MLTPKLKSEIASLWKKFWSRGITNPLTAIEQITYLLFMKRLDEMDVKKMDDLNKGYIDHYSSIFKGKFLPPGLEDKKGNYIPKEQLRWSSFQDKKAEDMLEHIRSKVFPFIQDLNSGNTFFTKHMKNAVFLIPSPELMDETYKTINEIYKEIERASKEEENKETFEDTQGDVYEYLLSELKTAGKNGQFRTPPHIIQLVTNLVFSEFGDEKLLKNDFRIADPACGTAGFLLAAYKQYLTRFTSEDLLKTDDDGFSIGTIGDKLPSDWHEKLEKDTFFGFDIDQTMVRIALMNLMMHGIQEPSVDYRDTLSKNYTQKDLFNIVLANPPFTGNISKGEINPDLKLGTTKTELLFIERIYQMLRNGGTAGVIIPQGVLFGSQKAYVETRKILVDKCELKAVIIMPSGVFKPYAGVATAILIYTKGGKTENVWFYEMENDGRSLDDKRTKYDHNGDLHDIIEQYKSRNPKTKNDRKAKRFFVSAKEIVDNEYDLSFNTYQEPDFKEIEYRKPDLILKDILELEDKIQEELKQLQQFL